MPCLSVPARADDIMEQKRFVKKDGNAELAEQKRKNRKRRRWLFYGILFLLLAVIFILLFVFVFLKATVIEVNGNTRYTDTEILTAAGISKGDNLLPLATGDNSSYVERKLSYIEECEIDIILPNKAIITVHEAEPYMYMTVGDDCYLLSRGLKVLERVGSDDLRLDGLIRVYTGAVSSCIVGTVCTFDDEREGDTIIEICDSIQQNGIYDYIKSIDVGNRFAIYLDYDERFEVYLGRADYVDIKIGFLVELVKQFESHEKGTIDLSNHKEAAVNIK